MDNKRFVFLVSADEAWIGRHKEALTRDFDLNVFHRGADCQTALENRQPDILILDTALPETDALALHRAVRDDFMTSDVYQLLLCREAELDSEGFSANDVLLMPCSDSVFRHKMQSLKQAFDDKAVAREQMSYAQNVALTAMSSMGELGVVMQFLSKSFDCSNIQSLAARALDALRQYELNGTVVVTWEGDSHSASTEESGPTESDLRFVEQMRTLGRIMEIEQRLVVNYDHVSILVSNLPDDAARCGRVRDNIATLCEGIESRTRGLLLEHDNILKRQGIRYAVSEIRNSVRNLYSRQLEDVASSRTLFNSLIDEYEDTFMHMEMNPEIENQLIGQLVSLRQKLTELVARPGQVSEKLQIVVGSLETLAGEIGAPEQ
jgi:CheY-like chemotaxis protein